MAYVHVMPALYVWNGTEWLLALPIYQNGTSYQVRQMYYSSNGSSWTT